MYNIMVKCPATGKDVSTGIATTEDTFDHLPYHISSMNCPHCGVRHSWTQQDAWLEGRKSGQNPSDGGLLVSF